MYLLSLIFFIALLLVVFVHLGILRKMKVSKVVWSCLQEMDLKGLCQGCTGECPRPQVTSLRDTSRVYAWIPAPLVNLPARRLVGTGGPGSQSTDRHCPCSRAHWGGWREGVPATGLHILYPQVLSPALQRSSKEQPGQVPEARAVSREAVFSSQRKPRAWHLSPLCACSCPSSSSWHAFPGLQHSVHRVGSGRARTWHSAGHGLPSPPVGELRSFALLSNPAATQGGQLPLSSPWNPWCGLVA